MTVFCSMSADFCSPPAGSTHKSINGWAEAEIHVVQRKMVTLIYPDPKMTITILRNVSQDNDPQHNDTQYNATHRYRIRHNDNQQNSNHHNDSQHNDPQNSSIHLRTYLRKCYYCTPIPSLCNLLHYISSKYSYVANLKLIILDLSGSTLWYIQFGSTTLSITTFSIT
jgi:hypothetical protein